MALALWQGLSKAQARISHLEAQVDALTAVVGRFLDVIEGQAKVTESDVLGARARNGLALTREEAAALLGVSTKTIQRMEKRRNPPIRRLPYSNGVALYAAGDVLRLASAPRKER